jgi:hypothetical protein
VSPPIRPEDHGRLNVPRIAALFYDGGDESLKCRWCGTWETASSSGVLECQGCDRAPAHPSTKRGTP